MTRIKAKWRVEGEKCSRYFCNFEKRNFVEKTIPNLTLDDGRVIEDIKLIFSEQKEYYKNLYFSKQTVISQDNLGIFFDNDNPFLTKLTEGEMVGMEGESALPECLNVLKNMSNGKSLGLDGFTSEFYKFFWIDIQQYVIKSLYFAYENSLLSVSQKQRLITCLPKEGKPKHLLKKLACDIFIKCRLQNQIGLYCPKVKNSA
jgi:hypothetical protein